VIQYRILIAEIWALSFT